MSLYFDQQNKVWVEKRPPTYLQVIGVGLAVLVSPIILVGTLLLASVGVVPLIIGGAFMLVVVYEGLRIVLRKAL